MAGFPLSSGNDPVSYENDGQDSSCDSPNRAVARFQIETIHTCLIEMIHLHLSLN